LRQGHVFDIEVGKLSLRNMHSLNNEWGFIVEIKLNELEQYNAEVITDWSIVPERQGRPTMPSILPGGTIAIEHRNLQGLNRSLLGSITTSNFIDPQFEYIHPYLDGVKDPRNMTFLSSYFNSGKLSLFPPIWVDRAGVKANITKKIITQNEITNISQNGQRQLPNRGISADGPPITLSGTIDIYQIPPVEGIDKPPPPVLVLHGHYSGCIADLRSYDAFTLGGTYCVRGYNKGELGACRNILEVSMPWFSYPSSYSFHNPQFAMRGGHSPNYKGKRPFNHSFRGASHPSYFRSDAPIFLQFHLLLL
ncbi:hypothetical protein MKX03_037425, partial [Papaver bracteatum]